MDQSFGSMLIIMLLVIDPFANIPLAVSLLAPVPPARRIRVIARECAIAAVTLMVFVLFGRSVLSLFGLSDASVDISGGVVLLLIAIRMIFKDRNGIFGGGLEGEPFIVPLAIPLIAGPAAIGTVLLLASRGDGHLVKISAAVLVAVAITFVLLAFADRIVQRLGDHVLAAIERLMGIVLAAVAVEMLLRGITVYVQQLPR
jgi:MarC family membrane protein